MRKKKADAISHARLIKWSLGLLWSTSSTSTAGYISSFVLQVGAELTQLWVAAQVISEVASVLSTQHNPDKLYTLIIASLALMTLDKVCWIMMEYFERSLYLKGSANIYRIFNGQLAKLSVSQHNDPDVRQLIDRLEYEGYSWKPLNYSFWILNIIHSFVRFVTSSFILMLQLPLVVVILVAGTLPSLFINRKSGDIGWGIWGDVGESSRVFWGISYHLKRKEAMEEIIPQQSTPYLLNKAHAAINKYTTKALAVRRRYTKYNVAGGIFEMIMAGISYAWLVSRAVAGKIGFDGLVFLSSLIWQTLSSVRLVTGALSNILYTAPFMGDFVKFVELENDLPRAANPITVSSAPLRIEFHNVSFRYPRAKKPTLKNISIVVEPGDHIALVGLNGAGKTTLIRLLLRFYDPTDGTITVNGTDLREVDLNTYYKHIGTLFQSFNRYPLTFEDNIALETRPNKDKYNRVIDISGASSVVRKLKSKHTYLSPEFEDGADLSGGEWQRVAMARNLYAGGDMFILDEPTSAIDALAEQQIFEKLYRELHGSTLITVSHRFNTVRKANTILVLENGRIVERGTHAELMELDGLYHQMFTSQAEGYTE